MPAPLVKVLHRMQELFTNIVAALEAMLLFPSLFRDSSRKRRKAFQRAYWGRRTLDDFANEIDRLLTAPLSVQNMITMSDKIRAQFKSCLQASPVCMLPSYNHALPSGAEKGTYLALDVGGSTLRVALVELRGHGVMRTLHVSSSSIDNEVKLLEGTLFFDWMATKIDAMLQEELGNLIVQSCRARGLNIEVDAIVNDSSATLLSHAYLDPATRMSLILGTGTNVAIHFPVHQIGLTKFGTRPPGWFNYAKHVIINSEMSMFGGGILPMSRWDEVLNSTHLRPDYQPLEYMITGRYLGEIIRLIIVEAVETAQLFGGNLPHSMRDAYSFDTSIIAYIEADTSTSLTSSTNILQKEHTFTTPPSLEDMRFLQRVCQIVSNRAAGYLATAIHSMWCLRNEAEYPELTTPATASLKETQEVTVVESECSPLSLSIACDGSVINKYPGFRDRCQLYLNELVKETRTLQLPSISSAKPYIRLDPAPDSAIAGAAVAVAVAVAEKKPE